MGPGQAVRSLIRLDRRQIEWINQRRVDEMAWTKQAPSTSTATTAS